MDKEIGFVLSKELETKIEYGMMLFTLPKGDFITKAVKAYAEKNGVSLPENSRLTKKKTFYRIDTGIKP
jgi:hypothetical protein